MKIAIPVADGKLNLHFGHCAGFDIYNIASDNKTVAEKTYLEAPPHEPGLLPVFLGERGITHIVAGGMGSRARSLFTERGIKVTTGATGERTDDVVTAFLGGTLITGENACDH